MNAAPTPPRPRPGIAPPGFFDAYPQLWGSPRLRVRLNARYDAIVAANPDAFRGRRVLDLASNNGRWSFAALRAGAAHVTGVEGRAAFVDQAVANFRALGVPPDRYRFECADLFDALPRFAPGQFDSILILGFLYHTLRFDELFTQLRRLRPKHLILDTKVSPATTATIELRLDDVADPMNAVPDAATRRARVVVGYPTVAALEMLLTNFGFAPPRSFDWPAYLADHPHRDDLSQLRLYRDRKRVTLVSGMAG